MFDPVTGKLLDRDALRSLQFNGQGMKVPRSFVDGGDRKVTELLHADHGRTAGWTMEHKSGRVDANATPEAVNASAGME